MIQKRKPRLIEACLNVVQLAQRFSTYLSPHSPMNYKNIYGIQIASSCSPSGGSLGRARVWQGKRYGDQRWYSPRSLEWERVRFFIRDCAVHDGSADRVSESTVATTALLEIWWRLTSSRKVCLKNIVRLFPLTALAGGPVEETAKWSTNSAWGQSVKAERKNSSLRISILKMSFHKWIVCLISNAPWLSARDGRWNANWRGQALSRGNSV